jgi:hypothetical protein
MARAALIGGVATLVLTAVLGVAWATRERDQADSVPSPAPLFTLAFDNLAARREACTAPFVIDEHAGQARIKVVGRGGPTPPLAVTITGEGGYRATGSIPGGYAQPGELRLNFAPSPGRAMVARACIANRGARTVGLFASGEPRTDSRSVTRIGRRTVPDVSLAFYERQPVSALERAPATADRISTFRPGIVAPWLVVVLAVLFAIGVPVAAVAAVVRAAADDERGETPAP